MLATEGAPEDVLFGRGDAQLSPGSRCSMPLSLTAASTLTFSRSAAGFGDLELRSALAGAFGEADLIEQVDRRLRAVHDGGGRLVTFGGTIRCLPLLRARADRHMLFTALHLPDWGPNRPLHHDLARTAGRHLGGTCRLADTCRALALPYDLKLRVFPALGTSLHNRRDVLATFLLHLYAVAREERSRTPVIEGQAALSAYLRRADLEPWLQAFLDPRTVVGRGSASSDDAHSDDGNAR